MPRKSRMDLVPPAAAAVAAASSLKDRFTELSFLDTDPSSREDADPRPSTFRCRYSEAGSCWLPRDNSALVVAVTASMRPQLEEVSARISEIAH